MSVINGLAVARLCEGLKRDGFTPDIVVGHTGWGELMFVKDIWPDVVADHSMPGYNGGRSVGGAGHTLGVEVVWDI